jgi:hypothetical protein
VLAEAGDAQLVFGGDLAAGPLPAETLDRIMALDALVLRGNADRELLSGPSGGLIDEWVVGQLDDRHREYIAALPEQIELDVEGVGHVLFCHGSPRSDETCPGEMSKSFRLIQLARAIVEAAGIEFDLLDLSHLTSTIPSHSTRQIAEISRP